MSKLVNLNLKCINFKRNVRLNYLILSVLELTFDTNISLPS